MTRTLLLFLLGAALAAPARSQAMPPSPVHVDAATLETVGEKRLVTGNVRARRSSLVASRESGVLLAMPVREGDVVKVGDLLGKIDAQRLELEVEILDAQIAVQRALIAERESDIEQAERDLATLRDLSARSAANPKELADAATAATIARTRAQRARLDVAALAAQQALLAQRVSDMELRAPFAGLVVARQAEVGQWIGEGEGIVELISFDDLEAWLEVPQRYLGPARRHSKSLALRLDATGEEFSVDGPRIVPSIDPLARTFSIIAPLPAGSLGLAAGMSVTAWIPTGETAERLTISPDAILRNDVGTFVYVSQPPADNESPHIAIPVPVTVLFQSNGRVVVESARLAPQTPIVVEGNERLFPMMPIAPLPPRDGGNR